MDGKLLALFGAISFGLSPIFIKIGFARSGRIDAAVMIALVIGIPANLALLPFVGGLHWDQMTDRAFIGFALGGLLGAGIGRRWMYIAIDRIGASPATAIKNGSPLITTALAIALFSEPVTIVHWLATISIIGGIILVTWQRGQRVPLFNVGVLAAVASGLVFGVKPLVTKFGLEDASLPVTASLIGATVALAYSVILARPWRMTPSLSAIQKNPLRGPAVGAFLVSGILQTMGNVFMNAALAGDAVSFVYPIVASAPLFTVLLAWLFLRGTEPVGPRMVAGVAAVVAGVVLL